MHKRGQVAVFVVIGIVVIVLLVLVFAFRDSITQITKNQVNTQEFLNSEIKDIQENVIEECVVRETFDAVNLFLKNGGEFTEPLNYLRYNGQNYRILCQNIPGK